MEFRILTERDAEAFHHLYREALQTYPEAFYRTPEEVAGSVEENAAFLRERNGSDDFVLGALTMERWWESPAFPANADKNPPPGSCVGRACPPRLPR
jgi:hypothetical protein